MALVMYESPWAVVSILPFSLPLAALVGASMVINMHSLPSLYPGRHISITHQAPYWIIEYPWKTVKIHSWRVKVSSSPIDPTKALLILKQPFAIFANYHRLPLHPWNG